MPLWEAKALKLVKGKEKKVANISGTLFDSILAQNRSYEREVHTVANKMDGTLSKIKQSASDRLT